MFKKKKISKNIFSLGMVSLFTDISSQMIYPLLPVFLAGVLGVSPTFIGMLEGIAESTASFLKVFSGWFSDRFKKRKPLILLGYGLSAIGKPFLFLATLGWHVLVIRFFERLGKGIRTSPRDALIADSSAAEDRGRAFGIQRAMDRTGAFIGPLVAFAVLPLINNDLRLLFFLAFFPALVAVLIVIFYVKEEFSSLGPSKPESAVSGRRFNREFKIFILVLAVFTLGNSSDAFLILRAKDAGISIGLIPVLWFFHNLTSSITAAPLGILSDRIGRRKTTLLGFLVYALVYFGFAFSSRREYVWLFMGLYGVYYGLSEGVLRVYVADLTEDKAVLGTAYGIYNMAVGFFAFPASLIMGVLWQKFGPQVAFSFGALLALFSALILSLFVKK